MLREDSAELLLLCSQYATRDQLKDMAEAVKQSLKSALTAQAKRIADAEEKRSELCAAPRQFGNLCFLLVCGDAYRMLPGGVVMAVVGV